MCALRTTLIRTRGALWCCSSESWVWGGLGAGVGRAGTRASTCFPVLLSVCKGFTLLYGSVEGFSSKMELDTMKWRISHMCPQANKTEALRDWFPVNAWFPGDRSLPLQHRSSAKNLSPPSSQWTCCSESAGLSPLWSLRPKDSASQTTSRLAQLATVCVSHTAHPLLSVRVLSCFSRVRLCDRVDCSPPGSSVRGILQAIILEWAAVPPLQGIFWPEDGTRASCISWYIAGGFFTNESPREAPLPLLLLH